MATIKDVAKKAGVSLATVSNVMNGKNTVQSKFVKAVEQAMAELEYVPNARAQGLKNNRSKEFAIILPNVREADYAEVYTGFQHEAVASGFLTSLFTTDYSKEREREIIHHIVCQKFCGAAIVTCMPANDDAFLQLERAQVKTVFVLNKAQNMENRAFLGMDYSRVVRKLIAALKAGGYREIALICGHELYSNEGEIKRLFLENLERAGLPVAKNSVYMVGPGKDNGFCAALRWMDGCRKPEAIVTSKYEYARDAIAAVNFHNSHKKVRIITLDRDGALFSQTGDVILRVPMAYAAAGEKAARMLVRMAQPGKAKAVKTSALVASDRAIGEISGLFSKPDAEPEATPPQGHAPLRLLLLKSASAQAIRQMLHGFEKSSGIKVEARIVDYRELYNASAASLLEGDSDVVSVCNAWLREFVQSGRLSKIESDTSAYSVFKKQFPRSMPDCYSTVDDSLYALPYILDAQLLFYRKDLFENLKLRRMFYERYKYELKPPEDALSYMDTAEFFTREFNDEAPTLYGTAMVSKGVNAIYEIMPIFWERGGLFFAADGRLSDDRGRFAEALEIYRKLLRYSPAQSAQWESWAQKAKSFCGGSVAMMPLYQAHFMDEYSPFDSAVGNNVGVCRMPFKHSVLGGWCLGIPERSPSKAAAMQFLQWLYMDKNAIVHNMLGGSVPTKYSLQYSDLNNKTAWMHFALNQLEQSVYMLTPNERVLNQWKFETAVCASIEAYVRRQAGAEDTAGYVFDKLRQMLEGKAR